MDDSEKPFACLSPGCNMSFTNEDHLVVHKKKHDMVLNLGGNGKNNFVADQTPTPTRFIRNCEEVGLFQDLQNVNPFEETFRRAVEAGKTGSLSESEGGSNDDTLHTPHIFPNLSDAKPGAVVALSKKSNDPQRDERSTNDHRNTVERTKQVEITVVSREPLVTRCNDVVSQQANDSVVPRVVETTRTWQNLSINGQEVELLLKTADGKVMQLSAVPMCANRRDNDRIDGEESPNVVQGDELSFDDVKIFPSSSRLAVAKMRLKEALTKNGSTTAVPAFDASSKDAVKRNNTGSNEKISVNVEQRRKQDIQARNRASSMRARAKRKAWIQQLQRTAVCGNERNAALQSEVKALRCEVAKLRALLLAHENCPVTKAMERGSLVQTMVQNINIRQSNAASRRKRTTNFGETPIAPKISKSSMRHLPILPKVDPSKRDLSVLKIIDVRTLPSEDESCESIVVLKNPPRRLELARPNPPTLRIDNAASKCTGT